MYKACNIEKALSVYIVMYGKSNEEERYLCSLRKEQIAFEELVREQGVCFFLYFLWAVLVNFTKIFFSNEL